MEIQKTSNSQTILRKKNGTGGINLPDFRLYYKAIVIKTIWYWHKDRNIEEEHVIRNHGINKQIPKCKIFYRTNYSVFIINKHQEKKLPK